MWFQCSLVDLRNLSREQTKPAAVFGTATRPHFLHRGGTQPELTCNKRRRKVNELGFSTETFLSTYWIGTGSCLQEIATASLLRHQRKLSPLARLFGFYGTKLTASDCNINNSLEHCVTKSLGSSGGDWLPGGFEPWTPVWTDVPHIRTVFILNITFFIHCNCFLNNLRSCCCLNKKLKEQFDIFGNKLNWFLAES